MSPAPKRIPTVPAVLSFGLGRLPLGPLALVIQEFVRVTAERHPEVFARMGQYASKSFAIDPTDLPFIFLLKPRAERPTLTVMRSHEDVEADARIAGPVAALLGLMHGAYDGDALFFSRDLVVEGDVDAVVALRNALDNAEIDLLAEAAAMLGPLAAAAEQVGRLAAPMIGRLTGLPLTRPSGATR
jgi:predicted lipid carrier protein YhbT